MDNGFQAFDKDFSIQDIDDAAIASAIEKVINDADFQKYLSELTPLIQNIPAEGRILELDLNQFIGKDDIERLDAGAIPSEDLVDDYYIAELQFKRGLAIYFALAREYKRLSGNNFRIHEFKGKSEPQSGENLYGNLSGVQTADAPRTIKGMSVDDDNLSAIDENLIRISKEITEMIPLIEDRRMRKNTQQIVAPN